MFCVSTASIPPIILYECNCGYHSKPIKESIVCAPLPMEYREEKEKVMSNLISTQEAVTKIVDTAIRKILSGEQKLTKEYEQSVKDVVNVILNTAQCEIVRCKDCKYYDGRMCGNVGLYNSADDYCSRAERREDEML